MTCNQRHHELVLIASDQIACDHIGLEVERPEDFETLREAVRSEGFEITNESPEEPGLTAAIRFIGPGGFTFELFQGMEADQPPDYETVGVRPVKFEHVTIKVADKAPMEAFLEGVLGFRLSDRAGESISWFRCSAEHHGISVIQSSQSQLQHYAWQIRDWSAIALVGDRLAQQGRAFLWGPGHHGIGDNYFCYFVDIDGVIVEYSANIQRIDNELTYVPRTWPDHPLSVNRWGNPPPPLEFSNGGIPIAGAPVGTPE